MKKTILAFSILLGALAVYAFPGWMTTTERVDKEGNIYELTHTGPNEEMYLVKYNKEKKKLWDLDIWNEGESKNGFYVQVASEGTIVAKELYDCSFKNGFESFVVDEKSGVVICMHSVKKK